MIVQIAVLVLLLISLINYKGAAGIRRIQQAQTTGSLHFTELLVGRAAESKTSLSAVPYLKIVWPALVFGILVSAAVRSSISRTPLHRIFNGVAAHDQLAAALAPARREQPVHQQPASREENRLPCCSWPRGRLREELNSTPSGCDSRHKPPDSPAQPMPVMQHVFPSQSLQRFCNDDGRVELTLLRTGKRLGPHFLFGLCSTIYG